MRNKLLSCLFLFLLLFSDIAHAQIRISSPYSRFGLGQVRENNNAWNFSLANLGIGIRSPYHVNISNPASYTAFDSSSFVFEGGFLSEFVELKSVAQSENRNYTSVGYLLFGLPATKWWRTSIGLVPFSDVGYNVASPEYVEGIGSVERIYSGSGGIYRFFWGNGFKITKNLSVGFNASYLFGTMNRQASAIFPDSIYFLNTKVDNYITLNDIYFNYGIQYMLPLKKDLRMTTGLVFAPASKMSAQADILVQNFFLASDGIEHPRDTLLQKASYRGDVLIPMMIGAGVSFEKTDKWIAGIDVRWQNWKKFKAFDVSDSLVNSFQVNAGAEFLPDVYNFSSYVKRIRYRIGILYNSTYLDLRGKHLNEYAVSLGFGLPLRGVRTNLNLGVQFGTRGTTSNNLIQETYLKFVVGFSIYERWFVKRKYY